MKYEIDFIESYDEQSILEELRRLAGTLGKSTLSKRDLKLHRRVSADTVVRRFGSLRIGLEKAGLTSSRFTKSTDEELHEILIELWTITLEKFGRSPRAKELQDFGFPVSKDTYTRRFGSWRRALLSAAESVAFIDDGLSHLPISTENKAINLNARRPLSTRKRFLVLKRDRYRCKLYGHSGVALEVDHIIPVAQGGTDALDNLQTLCFDCNRGKRDSLQ